MKNDYNLERILESFYQKGSTKFLNPKEYLQVKNRIPKNIQNIYKPYNDATKVIIYKNTIPNIVLCKISFNSPIKHSYILKELFVLGLKEDTFGDIVVKDNIAYIYLLEELYDYVKYNFSLNKISIDTIESINLDYLNNYEPEYEEIKLIVPSLRIDNVVSSITNDSRKSIIERFKNKDVILNYEIVTKYTTTLQERDVFSIRRFGKYKFIKIFKNTKKGSYIIIVTKYL